MQKVTESQLSLDFNKGLTTLKRRVGMSERGEASRNRLMVKYGNCPRCSWPSITRLISCRFQADQNLVGTIQRLSELWVTASPQAGRVYSSVLSCVLKVEKTSVTRMMSP